LALWQQLFFSTPPRKHRSQGDIYDPHPRGSDRYRNVVNFVEALFTGFQPLLGYHPKWCEVNIMAELSGWRRFPPVEQWLQRDTWVVAAPNLEELRAIFFRFIDSASRQRAAEL
jgi:hypothetical protein